MLPEKKISVRFNLDFKLENLFAILVTIEVILLLVDLLASCCGFVEHSDLRALMDITLEANIPTWFSSTQAFFTGLVALLVGWSRHLQKEPKKALGWYLIGSFFAYLGIDDAAQIHERVSTFVNDAMKDVDGHLVSDVLNAFPSYHWQLFFLPVFIIIGLLMMVFLYRELTQHKALGAFVTAMACYAIAVGLDYIDAVSSYYHFLLQYIPVSFDELEHLLRAIEEFLEMLGTTFFMMAFLMVYEPLPEDSLKKS